jgi:hypothetical protein
MAIEQVFEALPLHYLQHGISKYGIANIALAVCLTATLGVLADYAWMLYLRSKMVSTPFAIFSEEWSTNTASLLVLYHIQSSATRFNFQTPSPGYISKNSRRSITHL